MKFATILTFKRNWFVYRRDNNYKLEVVFMGEPICDPEDRGSYRTNKYLGTSLPVRHASPLGKNFFHGSSADISNFNKMWEF